MAIVVGFDVHRAQITFDALDTESGGAPRPDRCHAGGGRALGEALRWSGDHVAVEACTGWLFVCDALVGAGGVAHLAEPVETRGAR
jgi:transposase